MKITKSQIRKIVESSVASMLSEGNVSGSAYFTSRVTQHLSNTLDKVKQDQKLNNELSSVFAKVGQMFGSKYNISIEIAFRVFGLEVSFFSNSDSLNLKEDAIKAQKLLSTVLKDISIKQGKDSFTITGMTPFSSMQNFAWII